MAQLSRPYQFGLLGVVLLAAVWLVLLQGHSSSSPTAGSGASAPAVQTVTTSVTAKHAGTQVTKTKIYHGSAPGVTGLTRAIAKAQGAVTTSQQNANTLEQKSASASNEAAATTPAQAPAATGAVPAKALTTKSTTVTKVTPTKTTHVTVTKTTARTAPLNQQLVEGQLAKGKIALILFWDPSGSDDVSVHKAVKQVGGKAQLKVAVNYAGANAVASFGTITRGIQVYGTPTLLIVNKNGQTITLTGLQDSFAIEQAISEARHS